MHNIQRIVETTTAFKILSDPTRLKILCVLKAHPEGMCVYELADAVGISQSAASHQLAKLEAYKVVESHREGQTICYELCTNASAKKLVHVIDIFHTSSKPKTYV